MSREQKMALLRMWQERMQACEAFGRNSALGFMPPGRLPNP